MTTRRRIALGCLGVGLLAAWALYPRMDSRFVGSWKLDYEDLPFHLGRDGVMTSTAMSQSIVTGPDGKPTISSPRPTKVYQRWQIKDDKLVFGETGEPSFALVAVCTVLEYLDVEFDIASHDEFTIVSVSPDEIVLDYNGGMVEMVRDTDKK
jgi:hypothetical protein